MVECRFQHEHPSERLSGVLCYDEYGVALASHLAHHMGLPGIPYDTLVAIRNKHKVGT